MWSSAEPSPAGRRFACVSDVRLQALTLDVLATVRLRERAAAPPPGARP
jgi:hypothetical protein